MTTGAAVTSSMLRSSCPVLLVANNNDTLQSHSPHTKRGKRALDAETGTGTFVFQEFPRHQYLDPHVSPPPPRRARARAWGKRVRACAGLPCTHREVALVANEHDGHVGVGVLPRILQPAGQMIESLPPAPQPSKYARYGHSDTTVTACTAADTISVNAAGRRRHGHARAGMHGERGGEGGPGDIVHQ